MPTTRSKGKGRATDNYPSERDPLLPSNIHTEITDRNPLSTPRTRKAGSILYTVSAVLISILLGIGIFLALLVNSFRPSEREIVALQKTAFKYDNTPTSVSVLNVTDDGVLVNATILCGIDLDRAMGIQRFESEEERQAAEQRGERGTGAVWWENLRRWAAKKGMGTMSDRNVIVDMPAAINIYSQHSKSTPLIRVHLKEPMQIPMVSGVSASDSTGWLAPVPIIALVKPIASTGELMEFGQRGWAAGSVSMKVEAKRAVVTLPGLRGWMEKYASMEKENIIMDIAAPIPHFPGLPEPGHPIDFAKMVNLEGYHLGNDGDNLEINAGASMPNFARTTSLNATIPYGLPFRVVIPNANGTGEKILAEVITEPVILDHTAEDIKLRMSGRILSEMGDGSGEDESPLGPFIHNFLTGIDNHIIVKGLSTYPDFASNRTVAPPSWALSSLSSININLVIPGPQPPPKIINSMNMEHMKLSRSDGKTRASGTVVVEIDLPGDIGSIDVNVTKVLPEVFMFDGPVPIGNHTDGTGYPSGAFGHIKPDDYLDATTVKGLDPDFPNRLTVRAPLENVPVEILPGRAGLLASFARKVLFNGGATAGVQGSADAKVKMQGISGKVLLDGLPILGETWVGRQQGKQRMGEDEWW